MNPFHRAAVVKDPDGCLLTEYLWSKYGVTPGVIIKHPLSFVASIKRMGFVFDWGWIRDQVDLVEDCFADEEDFLLTERGDPLEVAACVWRAVHKVLLAWAAHHPEWQVVTHEELCREPLATFRRLYDALDLPWSTRIERRIVRFTSPDNPVDGRGGQLYDLRRDAAHIFRARVASLSAEERQMVRRCTEDVAQRLYGPDAFDVDVSCAAADAPWS